MQESAATVDAYLTGLQTRIIAALEKLDGTSRFTSKHVDGARGDRSRACVLGGDGTFEHAAVNFTHAVGDTLPEAATRSRPGLAGAGFEAVSLSLIAHPRNPYVPTTHMNLRFFTTRPRGGGDAITWWFGGGFDLTPYYGFDADAVHWHRTAHDACAPFGPQLYTDFKRRCDEYFFLPHRDEPRGIGGLFFDDWTSGGFDRSLALVASVGDHFLDAYAPIVEGRRSHPYGERQRDFQLYRRGRYVEFNLLYDRGTRYGIQSGRRVESVLASLPPVVHWRYDWQAEPGSDEARLLEHFLTARDWLAETAAD